MIKLTQVKKVLVVDDSAFMRKVISDFLNSHPNLKVAGVARNGEDALQKIKTLKPDVITLDVEMPVMNGLEALQEIMKEYPIPVVMLSSTTKKGADNTMLAMEYGAVDFVAKPGGAISLNLIDVKDEIIEKVVAASSVNITTLKRFITSQGNKKLPIKNVFEQARQSAVHIESPASIERKIQTPSNRKFTAQGKQMVLIGTSTGGPRALQEVLKNLPENVKAPILIVQHMPAGFTKSLAQRLNHLCEITVKEAENGDILEDGTAYIAPGGKHLMVRKLGTSFVAHIDTIEAPRLGHRPSVNVLFESAANIRDLKCLAVIMTGMGNDGLEGVKQLKENCETITIAESEETSVVYGMPRAIIENDLADEVVKLEQIAMKIKETIQ